MIIIFSYNRPQMLQKLIDEVGHCVVIDDGSDFEPITKGCDFHRLDHGGKEGFWVNWQYAFDICRESKDEFFLFLPDDVIGVQYNRILYLHSCIEGAYCFNVLNVNSNTAWSRFIPVDVEIGNEYAVLTNEVDCGYFCNREALEAINFKQSWVNPIRFSRDGVSSGVGQTQTRSFQMARVPMYKPNTSFAYHGAHESKMHPEERLRTPLISI